MVAIAALSRPGGTMAYMVDRHAVSEVMTTSRIFMDMPPIRTPMAHAVQRRTLRANSPSSYLA